MDSAHERMLGVGLALLSIGRPFVAPLDVPKDMVATSADGNSPYIGLIFAALMMSHHCSISAI